MMGWELARVGDEWEALVRLVLVIQTGVLLMEGVSHGSLEMQWEPAVMDACVGIGAENVLFHRSGSR